MLRNLKQWYAQQGRSLKTIGVGDYENDLDLMDCADISVCPANAMPEVKQKADHIFCDHNQGVIADIIEALEKGELE
jgi:hydroxymethylpyrimidine pyrophosphatase-like HAD family hydrolase